MALINKADADQVREVLARWLAATIPAGSDVTVSGLTSPTGSGLSNEIYLFDASWTGPSGPQTKGMVARVAPASGQGLFPVYHLEKEHRLMSLLAERTGVPVPPTVGVATDTSLLGEPFLVMERVHGQVPSDDPPYTVAGWVSELTEAQRAQMFDNALQRLVEIHQVDWRGLGLEFLERPQWGRPGLEQQLGYLDDLAGYALKGRPNPVVDAALDWARANAPTDEPLVLNWGDARPGNMMFAEDGSVAAILDWEMTCLGSPEMDLGLWLFVQRHHTEGIGAPLPAGIRDHAATAARYEELSGHQPRHLHYYEVLAGLQSALVMVRFADSMMEAGILPPDSDMITSNPSTQIIARLLGLPAPEGAATSFIGQRGN